VAPTALDTSIHHVTVYREGAVVTRVAELEGSWPDEVEVAGLPLGLIDESVRVAVVARDTDAAAPQPTDVRVGLTLPPVEPPPPPPPEARLKELRREIARLEARLRRIGKEQAAVDGLRLDLAPGPKEEPGRPPPAPLEAWLGLIDWTEAGRRRRTAERRDLHRELEAAREELARLERDEARARAVRPPDADEVSKRVVARLRGGARAGAVVLKLEYEVAGACWRPTYVLRVARDGRSAELGVRALVAQRSGEPWARVRLALSTADLRRDTRIPELASLRIGRAQPAVRKGGYREPPRDTDDLFRGLDAALAGMDRPPPEPEPLPDVAMDLSFGGEEVAYSALSDSGEAELDAFDAMDDDAGLTLGDALGGSAPKAAPPGAAFGGAPTMRAMAPQAASSPAPAKRGKARGARRSRGRDLAFDDAGGGAPPPPPQPPPPPEPRPGDLDYGALVLRSWDAPRGERGQLRPIRIREQLGELEGPRLSAVEAALGVARRQARHVGGFPEGTAEVARSSGAYDYRYDAGGLVDVPTDGAVHNVPLFAREAPTTLTLIAVPRESDQVVRAADLKNPLEAPLLAGPADVYLEDEFLVAAPIRTVPAGAVLQVGLGVEEGLKVARNTHFDETSKGGLLGGGTAVLAHRVELEVASRLAAPVRVEVRERIPVADEDDDDVAITVTKVEPAWEDYAQEDRRRIRGGKRWRFELAPGGERTLTYAYEVRIGAKQELAGGNRRD